MPVYYDEPHISDHGKLRTYLDVVEDCRLNVVDRPISWQTGHAAALVRQK